MKLAFRCRCTGKGHSRPDRHWNGELYDPKTVAEIREIDLELFERCSRRVLDAERVPDVERTRQLTGTSLFP